MPVRRPTAQTSRALAAGALVLVGTLVSSCGFDYATDRVNTISAGVNDRSGEVDVLGAVVVAGAPNVGVFAATLVNNSQTDADSLTGLSGPTDGIVTTEQTSPVELEAGGRVSLLDEGGIPVSGSFGVGQFVSVTLTFASGQTTTVQVDVVRPCFQYSPDKFPDLVLPTAPPADTPPSAEPTIGGDPASYSCDPTESTVAPDGSFGEEEGGEAPEEQSGDEGDTGAQE